jgi:hypothetical protein
MIKQLHLCRTCAFYDPPDSCRARHEPREVYDPGTHSLIPGAHPGPLRRPSFNTFGVCEGHSKRREKA